MSLVGPSACLKKNKSCSLPIPIQLTILFDLVQRAGWNSLIIYSKCWNCVCVCARALFWLVCLHLVYKRRFHFQFCRVIPEVPYPVEWTTDGTLWAWSVGVTTTVKVDRAFSRAFPSSAAGSGRPRVLTSQALRWLDNVNFASAAVNSIHLLFNIIKNLT